jgi:hypothetical protein
LTTRPLNDTELFPTALFLLRIAKNHLPTNEQVRNAVVHEELLLVNHKIQSAERRNTLLDSRHSGHAHVQGSSNVVDRSEIPMYVMIMIPPLELQGR